MKAIFTANHRRVRRAGQTPAALSQQETTITIWNTPNNDNPDLQLVIKYCKLIQQPVLQSALPDVYANKLYLQVDTVLGRPAPG